MSSSSIYVLLLDTTSLVASVWLHGFQITRNPLWAFWWRCHCLTSTSTTSDLQLYRLEHCTWLCRYYAQWVVDCGLHRFRTIRNAARVTWWRSVRIDSRWRRSLLTAQHRLKHLSTLTKSRHYSMTPHFLVLCLLTSLTMPHLFLFLPTPFSLVCRLRRLHWCSDNKQMRWIMEKYSTEEVRIAAFSPIECLFAIANVFSFLPFDVFEDPNVDFWFLRGKTGKKIVSEKGQERPDIDIAKHSYIYLFFHLRRH